VNKNRVDAETRAPCEGFPRDLEQDSFEHVRTKYRMRLCAATAAPVPAK
jgi:hypothetical protein